MGQRRAELLFCSDDKALIEFERHAAPPPWALHVTGSSDFCHFGVLGTSASVVAAHVRVSRLLALCLQTRRRREKSGDDAGAIRRDRIRTRPADVPAGASERLAGRLLAE